MITAFFLFKQGIVSRPGPRYVERVSTNRPEVPVNPRWLALIALTALGGCKYWYTVTVPASDSAKPVTFTTLYYDGDHQVVGNSSAGGFHFVMSDADQPFFIVGSGIDSGGTSRVKLTHWLHHSCKVGGGSGGPSYSHTVYQSGSIGSTVENGLYTTAYMRFSNLINPCDYPGAWESTKVFITAEAEDFHGNTSGVVSTVTHFW